jgi:hypothetical protein
MSAKRTMVAALLALLVSAAWSPASARHDHHFFFWPFAVAGAAVAGTATIVTAPFAVIAGPPVPPYPPPAPAYYPPPPPAYYGPPPAPGYAPGYGYPP